MNDLILLLLVIFGSLVLAQLARMARTLERTATMMKRLLAHQGIEWETQVEPSPRVRELASNAETRIAAIKAYREQTGLGLREARAVVERLSRHDTGRDAR